ncbi:MAG: hypothetical protein ACI96V_001009 [Thalassolituus oleivorans]
MALKARILTFIGVALSVLLISHLWHQSDDPADINWEQTVSPGELSTAHAFLENNCEGCHTPIQGVTRENCVMCHANELEILQRQPTEFHADVTECTSCHQEHHGRNAKISVMDHKFLTTVGMAMLPNPTIQFDEGTATRDLLQSIVSSNRPTDPLFVHPSISVEESVLQCASCHGNDDRHFGLFGDDCASCHRTDQWSLPEFIHPSNQSYDCNQCHEAPPSHYMQHFKMISAKVAGQHKAKVEECFACHQSTSWNDIKRAGWYKHH